MKELITSFLVQKKECNLPLLGHFRIKTKPADFERAEKQIFPPTDEILYNDFAPSLSPDLITYIAGLRHLTSEEAENQINTWCQHAKERLDAGEKVIFNSLGSLQKDAAGNIFFQRKKNISLYEPVLAERVLHKNAEHAILVGDVETTSGVMNEFYRDEAVIARRIWWKIWATVLVVISIAGLLFYFFAHQFSETGIGNRASFPVKEPPASHRSP